MSNLKGRFTTKLGDGVVCHAIPNNKQVFQENGLLIQQKYIPCYYTGFLPAFQRKNEKRKNFFLRQAKSNTGCIQLKYKSGNHGQNSREAGK